MKQKQEQWELVGFITTEMGDAKRVTLRTDHRTYKLDLRKVEPTELSAMCRVLRKMNFAWFWKPIASYRKRNRTQLDARTWLLLEAR